MNKEIVRYQLKLRKHLSCNPNKKKQLLSTFESSLTPFLEDCPTPSYEQIEAAFGPPEEMASVLMETVPEKEKRLFQLWQNVRKCIFILLFILAIVFGVYAYCLKEWTIITVYDEVYPVTPTISQEGESK